jgi:hypothetical protein
MTTTGKATAAIGVVRRMITIGGATTAIAIRIVRAIGTTVAALMSVPFGTVLKQAVHRSAWKTASGTGGRFLYQVRSWGNDGLLALQSGAAHLHL